MTRTLLRDLIIPGQGVRATWRGTCQDGERWNAQDCNDKLIGARYYVAGFGKRDVDPSDFFSPRDADGHGSHTTSTAAGNAVDDVNVDGKEFGDISGMAPAAKVAMYKGSADLDLWVYQVVDGEEELIDLSADGDAGETVTLRDPEDGTYVAYVNGFAGDGNYQWTQWVVGDADAGNLVVTPDSQPVTVGETVTFDAAWSGLDTTKRWFGVLGWTNGTDEVGSTLVSIG